MLFKEELKIYLINLNIWFNAILTVAFWIAFLALFLNKYFETIILLFFFIPTYTKPTISWMATGGVGSGSGESAVAGGKIQVGTEANQTIDFTIDSVSTNALGVNSINVSTGSGATQALSLVDAAIEKVAGDRAEYGAVQNRLEYSVSNLLNVAEFTTAARSRIEDADFAAESARLSKAQVLQQSGTAMLAQANASQQLALSLFR